MAEGRKREEKQRNGKHRNETEIKVLETRYGLKVLVRQGNNKVWLNQQHLSAIFDALLARVFANSGEGGGEQ